MKFQKGKSGNPKGKKKGTLNKDTSEIRGFFTELIAGELANIKKSLDKIRIKNPAQYVSLLIALSEYCIPKLQRIEIEAEVELEVYDFTQLSTKELKQVDEITTKALNPSGIMS